MTPHTDDAAPRAASPPALELDRLTKTFGSTVAADRVTLVVPAGSFFGLVGPNGAGKTTSLAMAVGLLRPDSGTSRVLGLDVWSMPVEARRLLGVLPDGLALPERLTGRELLTFLGVLHGLDQVSVEARADELLGVLDLSDANRTLVIEYSTGMRKKDRAGGGAHPRATPPRPGRAVRGGRPDRRGYDPGDPETLRGRRWIGRVLQPCPGGRGAASRRPPRTVLAGPPGRASWARG